MPVTVTEPGAEPNPVPVSVIWRLASLARRYGRETEYSCGVSAPRSQTTAPTCADPGATATAATWVGAVSVTVYSPGQAWKLVAMVLNRGL